MAGIRRPLRALVAALALFASPGAALAQEAPFPNRPVKLVVPQQPGSSTDNLTRIFAEKLTLALGQPFVIDNRVGAVGAIGAEAVHRSAKDGYTLLVAASSTLLIVPNMRKTVFALDDFTPVAKLANSIAFITINPAVPATTMRELVDYSRANPGKIHYGTSGVGGIQHLRNESINRTANLGWVHVPYRGGPESLLDLLSNQIQVQMEIIVLPHVRTGKLRALAVMDTQRHADFPDVPTLKEASKGLPFENVDLPGWFILFAPAGTPPEAIRRLNAAIVAISRDPVIADRLFQQGYRAATDTPEQMQADLPGQNKLFADLIDQIGLRQE